MPKQNCNKQKLKIKILLFAEVLRISLFIISCFLDNLIFIIFKTFQQIILFSLFLVYEVIYPHSHLNGMWYKFKFKVGAVGYIGFRQTLLKPTWHFFLWGCVWHQVMILALSWESCIAWRDGFSGKSNSVYYLSSLFSLPYLEHASQSESLDWIF